MAALRSELYLEPYESIDWDKHRHSCCPLDEYQGLAIQIKTLGEDHPDVSRTYNNIAGVYDNQGKPLGGLVTPLQRTLHWILTFYETKLALHTLRPFSGVRKAGIKFAMDYIRAEDLQTNFIDIGPFAMAYIRAEDLQTNFIDIGPVR
ncbi:hypothetical protein T484DRAFT_1823888 [Baffinella frigidus]|nr:hypothetical protein T484DRAFT_1823888 [Cryptophyta sp. CCMP2293]